MDPSSAAVTRSRAMYVDDGRMTGRGNCAGWRALITNLWYSRSDRANQRKRRPRQTSDRPSQDPRHSADLASTCYLHTEGIDTSSASFALLDVIAAYRRAMLSEAFRGGQAKAVAAGKRIDRPIAPPGVETTQKALGRWSRRHPP